MLQAWALRPASRASLSLRLVLHWLIQYSSLFQCWFDFDSVFALCQVPIHHHLWIGTVCVAHAFAGSGFVCVVRWGLNIQILGLFVLSVGALSPCLCTFWACVVWIAIGDKLNQHFSFLYFTVLFYLIRITKNFIFYSFTTKLHDSMKYLFAKRKVDPINGDYKAIRCNKKISSCMYSHGISPPHHGDQKCAFLLCACHRHPPI